jgi:Sec-independent protein secretion pathway component TatC
VKEQPVSSLARLKNVLVVTVLIFICIGLIWLSISSYENFYRELHNMKPLIVMNPTNGVFLPLGIGLLAVSINQLPSTVIFLWTKYDKRSPGNKRVRKGKKAEARISFPAFCLGILFLSLLVTPFARTILSSTAEAAAAKHGYVSCPPLSDEWHLPPLRWVLPEPGAPLARCPKG